MTLPPPGGRRATEPLRRAAGRAEQGPRPISQSAPLVDAEQTAKLLGVPPTWLLAQARKHQVPHQRLGHYVRFDLDELIQWVRDSQIPPDGRGR